MATPDPEVEAALVSDRLCRLEEGQEAMQAAVAKLEATVTSLVGEMRQLVSQLQRREDREDELLRIERERRDKSAEAEARRVEAELAERKEARGWWREKVVGPVVGGLVGILTSAGLAVAGWLAGVFGDPK